MTNCPMGFDLISSKSRAADVEMRCIKAIKNVSKVKSILLLVSNTSFQSLGKIDFLPILPKKILR